MMALFTDIFQWLPLGHVIESKVRGGGGVGVGGGAGAGAGEEQAVDETVQVLVVHGGLFSKDETTLEEVRKVSSSSSPPSRLLTSLPLRLADIASRQMRGP